MAIPILTSTALKALTKSKDIKGLLLKGTNLAFRRDLPAFFKGDKKLKKELYDMGYRVSSTNRVTPFKPFGKATEENVNKSVSKIKKLEKFLKPYTEKTKINSVKKRIETVGPLTGLLRDGSGKMRPITWSKANNVNFNAPAKGFNSVAEMRTSFIKDIDNLIQNQSAGSRQKLSKKIIKKYDFKSQETFGKVKSEVAEELANKKNYNLNKQKNISSKRDINTIKSAVRRTNLKDTENLYLNDTILRGTPNTHLGHVRQKAVAGEKAVTDLQSLAYQPSSLNNSSKLSGSGKNFNTSLEARRNVNNEALEKQVRIYENSDDLASGKFNLEAANEINTLNKNAEKLVAEFPGALQAKIYDFTDGVGKPGKFINFGKVDNSLDRLNIMDNKVTKDFTLMDEAVTQMIRPKVKHMNKNKIVEMLPTTKKSFSKYNADIPNKKYNSKNSLGAGASIEDVAKKIANSTYESLKPMNRKTIKNDDYYKLFMNLKKEHGNDTTTIRDIFTKQFSDDLIQDYYLKVGSKIPSVNPANYAKNLPMPLQFKKNGGRIKLKTGGRVYLAPGGKVYQPTSSSGNSRVGMFESILSGIGAGILDIPRGAFSLGASLIDLGAGTDTAADIEMWFDDLTTLDERAEATTAGKITRIMTNLGIPGTAAFKAGSRMARSAIEAKEAGTLYKFTKNTEGALEKTLTNKGRMRQTLGGVAGVGASDAIFVGDAERIGTLGDAFNIGPTQLADNDENNAARSVMNRVKFGLDSAFLGGIIGGTGTAIKQAVQRSNNLNRNNDLIDKLLEYTTPQGKKTKEFFEMEREMIGRRSADANKAQELQRQLDKEIDALYGQMGQKFGIGVQKERTALTKVVNDALVSSADGPKVTPIVNAEGLTEGATFTLGNMTPESLSALSKAKLKNPEEVVRILQRARRTMDKSFTDIASNVFRFGKSTKEAADDTLNRFAKFKTAFETKSLDYIDDTYRIFGNKNSEALKGFKPTAEAVTSAKEMFKQLALKRTGKTISDEQAAYEVERILVSSKKQNKFLVEGEAVPLLQDETGFLKDIAIKDWTKPMLPLNKVAGEAGEDILVNGLTPRKIIEDLFGKVQDPSATILSTLSDLSLVRRKHEFFGDFYDTMAGKQMFNTRREAAAVFGDNNVGEKAIQMLSTNPGGKLNIEAVNPLNGRWSSKGIQEALEEVNSGWTTVLDKDNVFTTFYNNFVLYPKATSQLAKTVLSPVTHFRNLISATAFASANGIMPLMNKEALDEAMGAFSQVGARGSEAANKRYRELLRLGVVNKNARLGDLEDLLDDVDFGTTKFTNKVMQNLGKKLNKGKEYATDLYTAEDDFWKMYTFAAERKRIKTALEKSGIDANVFARSADNDLGLVFKNGEEYLDEAAANIVRNNVPNYDYVSKFIKDLRKAPIGNFVSFPAEIIRTSINILGKGFKEFNYVDPITKTKPFRSIGMQRMAGFGATAVAIPYGTVEAFKAAYNVSGMEMDALRRFVPDWSKNSTLVPIKDDDGNFTYIDFSHANAYDTMIRPFKTIMNAVADGRTDNDTVMEDLMQGVVESTTELGSPFISEAIWTQALTDVFVRNGRTRDGRRLYTEQTPYGDRFAKGLFHLVEAQTPGSASTIGRLFNSIFETPDKYGKQYDFTKEAAGIAGLRAVEINPVETMKYKIADYRTGINNSRREFTSPLLKGGVVTPEQIIDRYKLANESLYQVQKNMTKDFYGAMILGANENSLKREFKDRVSNKALRGIIQGQFKPFIPSENIEKSFRDQARELGNNSPFARAKDTIRRLAAEYSKLKLFGDRLPDFTNPFAGENTVLSTEGITSRLPSLNLGLNSLGGSATNNTSLTQAKGSKVFGSNDTVFGS